MRHLAAGLGMGLILCASGAAFAAPAPAPAAPKGDATAGQAYFKTCTICHSIDDKSKPIAPTLKGVVGRKIASVADHKYTPALSAKTGTWTPALLDTFLTSPKDFAPGTAMAISVAKPEDRANLIAYLSTLK